GGLELEGVGHDADFGIEAREPLASGLRLRLCDDPAVEEHLALKVGELDPVAVEESERAAAGRREIQRRRGSQPAGADHEHARGFELDRKSTRLNSSHRTISYAVFCLKKKNN